MICMYECTNEKTMKMNIIDYVQYYKSKHMQHLKDWCLFYPGFHWFYEDLFKTLLRSSKVHLRTELKETQNVNMFWQKMSCIGNSLLKRYAEHLDDKTHASGSFINQRALMQKSGWNAEKYPVSSEWTTSQILCYRLFL